MIKMENIDLVIIGAGPAGMSAAVAAKQSGIDSLLLVDRNPSLGGILQQCIHNGFGLHRFKRELSGPEYSFEFEKEVERLGIPTLLNTMVLELTADKVLTLSNSEQGIFTIRAKAVILAMGCRERSRGVLNIPGTRPAGIFSAGTAQRYLNMEGYLPGKEVVILGSGDIGLIMARRMTLEGAKVKAVCELLPYSGGLTRNIVQCLDDFGIPLLLSHTVTQIHGAQRLEAVTIAEVDDKRKPIPGTEQTISCDTLLLSCGLIPENELTRSAGIQIDPVTSGAYVNENRETSIPGIFACGNVLHVHDLVDYVSDEAEIAGRSAASYILGHKSNDSACEKRYRLLPQNPIRYTVPQVTAVREPVNVYFRVGEICSACRIEIRTESGEILRTYKKARCVPGEMESVTLVPSDFDGHDDAVLYLSLIKEES